MLTLEMLRENKLACRLIEEVLHEATDAKCFVNAEMYPTEAGYISLIFQGITEEKVDAIWKVFVPGHPIPEEDIFFVDSIGYNVLGCSADTSWLLEVTSLGKK